MQLDSLSVQNFIHLPDELAGVLPILSVSNLTKESSSPATRGGRGRREPCRRAVVRRRVNWRAVFPGFASVPVPEPRNMEIGLNNLHISCTIAPNYVPA